MMIRVVVHGASGKLGREIISGLCREADLRVVGVLRGKALSDPLLALPNGAGTVPYSNDLGAILDATIPDVVVDASAPEAAMRATRVTIARGISMVIATTGLSADDIEELRELADAGNVGVVVASNFALGAVLMTHLARIAARYMESAEIIELHHHLKADAPSGTALSTANAVSTQGGTLGSLSRQKSASRGQEVNGVNIHSVRLPGLMAHQEVLFGAPGQTLSIRHDTTGRECYIPGIVLAIREVGRRKGLTYGLDALLGL